LLETIVAIAVILSGVIGVMSLTISNLAAGTENQNRLTALNLAREAVEAARAIRDNAWLAGATVPWYQCVSSGVNCLGYTANGADITAVPILDPSSLGWSMYFSPNDQTNPSAAIYRDQNSLYRQSGTVPISGASSTIWRRLLWLYPICRNQAAQTETSSGTGCGGSEAQVGIRVVVEVKWDERNNSHSLKIEDFLYNWRYATIPSAPQN